MLKLPISLILTLLTSGCASTKPGPHDSMCAAIGEFAKAQTDGKQNSVILKTRWGGGGDFVFWKHCEAFEYEPGKKLCAILLQYSYSEFPQDNLNNVVKCLADKDYRPIQNALVELHHVIYNFGSVNGISKSVGMSVEFYGEMKGEPSTLIITAEHFDDNE